MKKLIIIFSLLSAPAYADETMERCQPREQVLQTLKDHFNERPVSVGLTDANTLVVITASPGGATWTALSIDAKGLACALSAGTAWDNGARIEKPSY